MPPSNAWGVAGYSEGGFCAANMALRYPDRYGYAASMSGYFTPYKNKFGNPLRTVSPFGNDNTLRVQNTPLDEVRTLAAGASLPLFWLGAGQGSGADISNAEYFAQLLQLHEADAVLADPGPDGDRRPRPAARARQGARPGPSGAGDSAEPRADQITGTRGLPRAQTPGSAGPQVSRAGFRQLLLAR
jgi:pimeloyl-ACP methyl ester carboxylesterase